jgi:phosphoribosylformylglycinamidine synthase subunit PurL
VFGREEGDAPPVDLEAERRHGEFLRANRALVRRDRPVGRRPGAGGLRDGRGRRAGRDARCRRHGALFGEDQARYLVACSFDQAEALMAAAGAAGVPLALRRPLRRRRVRWARRGAAGRTLHPLPHAFARAIGAA